MDTAVENALRSQARRCRQEIIAQTQGKPKKQHDPITTAILDSHAKKSPHYHRGNSAPNCG